MERPRTPPKLATALLKRLSTNDALGGDLREEYASGKSAWWYWGQVLAMAATTVVRDVRAHPLLTIRGIVVARLLLWLTVRWLYYALRFDEVLFASGFRWFYVNGMGLPHWLQGQLVVSCVAWVVCAVCGWIVARLHRPYGLPILIANGAFAYLMTAIFFVPNPYVTPLGVLNLVMYPVVTLIGGLFDNTLQPADLRSHD